MQILVLATPHNFIFFSHRPVGYNGSSKRKIKPFEKRRFFFCKQGSAVTQRF